MDPKSSVMNYIAENMPAGYPTQQPGSPTPVAQNSTMATPHNQAQHFPQGSFVQAQATVPWTGQMPIAVSQSTASVNPAASSQVQNLTPYFASNLNSSTYENTGKHTVRPQTTASQPQGSLEQDYSLAAVPLTSQGFIHPGSAHQTTRVDSSDHGFVDSLSKEELSLSSLSLMPKQNTSQSAPRQYHRMVLNFELVKSNFLAAKTRESTILYQQGLTSLII